jgi:hypothetical protein
MLVHLFKNKGGTLDESGTYDGQKQIYNLYLDNIEFINNWDIVDISACNIVGAYLYEKDKALLYRLVYADNPCGSAESPSSPLFILSDKMNLMIL